MKEKLKKTGLPSKSEADFKAALSALERAAKRAQETARKSKTPLVLWQDGRVKTVRPGAAARSKGKS
jgi:hypothetical protein